MDLVGGFSSVPGGLDDSDDLAMVVPNARAHKLHAHKQAHDEVVVVVVVVVVWRWDDPGEKPKINKNKKEKREKRKKINTTLKV